MPSMVVTWDPSACAARMLHDLMAWPSRWTVQAPHCAVSQPTCVPVSPSSSRRNWTSRMWGSTVAVYFLERHVKNGDIHNLGDALFFTTVQLLTVSSQIKNPLSVAGRVVDIFLEIWAVVVVAGSAGAIASFFQTR